MTTHNQRIERAKARAEEEARRAGQSAADVAYAGDQAAKIHANPNLQAVYDRMEREEAARKEEEQRGAVRLEELREKEFTEALEAQYQDRLRFYSLQGVPQKVFDEEIWPMQRQLFILGEEDAVDHERRERSSSPW